MNRNLEQLQSLLDENKESLGDDLYLKMCELNKAQYKDSQNCFYRVTYCVAAPEKTGTTDYILEVKFKSAIIQIPHDNYLHVLTKITGCQHDLVFSSVFEQLPKFTSEMIASYYSECCAEAVCDCDSYTKVTVESRPKLISIMKM